MRAELAEIERIENYLMSKLDPQDKANFENEMGQNATLKEQVDFQRDLVEGLQRMGLKHDTQKAYKIYRMRLWLKYLGIGFVVVAGTILTVILLSHAEVNYCNCQMEQPVAVYGDREVSQPAQEACVDTCGTFDFIPDEARLSTLDEKVRLLGETAIFLPEKEVQFSGANSQETIVILDAEPGDTILQEAIPAIEADNGDDVVEEEEDDNATISPEFDPDDFFLFVDKMDWAEMRVRGEKPLYLHLFQKLFRRNQKLGTILKTNNNEAYFDAAKEKRNFLELDEKYERKYVVNTEVKVDSSTMETYFEYDTIPATNGIPPLRMNSRSRKRKGRVSWNVYAEPVAGDLVDIVFEVVQVGGSYIYGVDEKSDYNMPTQFLFRHLQGDYELMGDVTEIGIRAFDKEENYSLEGPVFRSDNHQVYFKQRVKMNSDTAALYINYAYMVCERGVSTQYPQEDSVYLQFGWKTERSGNKIEENLGLTGTEIATISCPNAFTPNGDGINDFFRIRCENLETFSVVIYDQDGSLLFTSKNPNFEWDGRDFSGQLMPEGAYVMEIKSRGKDGKILDQEGQIYLTDRKDVGKTAPVSMDKVDVEPQFPGGESALFQWLGNQMDLDALDGDGTISGVINVDYTVSKTGKVTDVVIVDGLSPQLDKHVKEIFERMPAWSPGMVDGEPVAVYFSLPVHIRDF